MTTKNIDLPAIRKQLPHGSLRIISNKSGVNIATVSRAFGGDKRSMDLPKIIKATAEHLAEIKAEENEAIQAMEKVMSK